jgi:hypothetical protein
MRVRKMMVAGLALLLAIALPAVTGASSQAHPRTSAGPPTAAVAKSNRLPRLLTLDFSSTFAVRPAMIVPTGDGWVYFTGRHGRNSHIHWKKWTRSKAQAVVTQWMRTGVGMESTGRRATVLAFRVRKGRFTRMTVRYYAGDLGWDPGHKLYVDHYRLTPAPYGYSWGG